jgi:cyclic beta-1,2-glucan synthetase
LAQIFLSLTFLAFHAFDTAHAIAITLVRLVVTKAGCWSGRTARPPRSERPALVGHKDMSQYDRQHDVQSDHRGRRRDTRRRVAARCAAGRGPFLLLWTIAPVIAYWLSVPVGARVRPLADRERMLLRRTARKTWRYFETFVTDADGWLPPDNFQESEEATRLARRTSPTNIGMAMLSTLAAHDLGYVTTNGSARAVGRNAGHAGKPRTIPRALPELVRHRHACAVAPALRLDRSTAGTLPDVSSRLRRD